jgi:hypothetical protein
MASTAQLGIVGLTAHELNMVQSLLRLLRHPDPVVSELACQALAYLELVAAGDRPRGLPGGNEQRGKSTA